MVEMLVQEGGDVSQLDKANAIPLHHAVGDGHVSTAQLLLDLGSDPTIKNTYGNTPAMLAKLKNHPTTHTLLLTAESNYNAKAQRTQTTIDFLEAIQTGNRPTTTAILNSKFPVDAPLDAVGAAGLYEASRVGTVRIVKLLLSRGAMVNRQDLDGCTALHGAARGGCVQIVPHLLKAGVGTCEEGERGGWSWGGFVNFQDNNNVKL